MQYLYYRVLKLLTRVKTNDTPALNAMVLITAIQGLNVFSIFDLIKSHYKWEFNEPQAIIIGLSFYIILLIPNYFYLFLKKNKIVQRFNNETNKEKVLGIVWLMIYIVLSIAIFTLL